MEELNKKIIIDAGHGGIDGGAIGNGLIEKELNLQASNYMYNRFKELGIPVKMTRKDDEYLPKTERVNRVKELYNNDANVILISNHINAGGGEGAEVVYSLKNEPTLAQRVLDNIGAAGQIKRKIYQRRLPENPNKDYYYILRETGNLEPILIEYGFIDNERDSEKLKNNLNDYAEAVVKAVAEYAGYRYKTPEENKESEIYIVKKGDTLYSIANNYNITVAELKKINNLANNTISIGQKLYIKNDTNENITDTEDFYTVQKGDTLYSISKKFNISVEEIKKINNLKSNTLSIGQKLNLNGNLQDNETNEIEYDNYTVQRGDSLWSIAQKYNITVNELINLNELENTILQIGQNLKVPKINIVEPEYEIYIVKKGDTLWSISKENGLTVNEIKELNNLTSNLLSVGQEIKIKRT